MVENFEVFYRPSEVHKTLFLLFCFLFLLYLKNLGGGGGGEDVASDARVAIGNGWVSGEYLGRGMISGIRNPS